MTVQDLRKILDEYPDDAVIVLRDHTINYEVCFYRAAKTSKAVRSSYSHGHFMGTGVFKATKGQTVLIS